MQSSLNAILLRVVGIILLIVGVVALFAARAFASEFGALGGFIAGGLGGGMVAGGTAMFNYARRLRLAKEGPLPPAKGAVIYLRSFAEDSKTDQGVSSGALGNLGLITEEEQLVASLSSVGSVIAVGRPHEQLPELGATRLHFTQDEWQEGVHKLLREGSVAVIRPGSFSPGVRWEIQQALKQLTPEHLLLIVGGRAGTHQDSDLAEFAAQVSPMLPHPLPTSYDGRKLYRLGTIRAFVRFDSRWTPTLLPVAIDLVPYFRRTISRRLVPYYQQALRPVLTDLGYSPSPLPLSAGMVTIAVGFGLLLLLLMAELLVALFG